MKYKVVYVCYLTRRGVQKQYAFVSKATEDVRIDSVTDKELHFPLVTVEFFKTRENALEDARKYCSPECIF